MTKLTIVVIAFAFSFTASSQVFAQGPSSAEVADIIYSGGDIVTVNDAAPTAEALAVKDGKILAVGSAESVLKTKGDTTQMIDLSG